MSEDIRDKAFITHDDVVGLNFIRSDGPFVFRRHFRQGLRSHILEVLDREAVALESSGTVIDGVRWFPKAEPIRVFRIFRTRLESLDQALKEIGRVKIVERYLAPDHMAMSTEFLVDYAGPGGMDILLCGFQAYERGEIVDPWSILDGRAFCADLHDRLRGRIDPGISQKQWIKRARQQAGLFIRAIKKMMQHAQYVPDLAGIGNLLITPGGIIKLVDINNISKVDAGPQIILDDRGYPVCDKSVEALSLLESKMVGGDAALQDPIYETFLNPQRQRLVRKHEALFHRQKKHLNGYPALRE